MAERVFLDANVLFSAAYRDGSGLSRLWMLDGARLVTSAYAIAEVHRNLPAAAQRTRLEALLESVEQASEAIDRPLPADVELPEKDRPILLAAVAAGAAYLLTGDVTHFGRYYEQTIAGVRILPPAAFLREREG